MSDRKAGDLTQPKITAAALDLLDDVGLDALTVRRLAAELGVKSPALYWHFSSKQQLLDQMADVIVLSAGMGPPRASQPWQQWLAERGRGYRQALLSHRDGARVVLGASTLSSETLTRFDDELTGLIARGFSPAMALRTITVLNHYITGYVLQEQAERPAASAAERLTKTQPALESLVSAIRQSGGVLSEDVFEHGLDVLITGTAVALQDAARPGSE